MVANMTRTERWALWTALLVLGGFLPIWWALVFTGYYENKASADTIAYMKSFLLSDLSLVGLVAGLIHGLLRNRVHGHLCGLAACAIGIYMCIHGFHAMVAGPFPHDVATVWLYTSNGVGLPIVAWVLLRNLKRGFAE